MEKIIFNFKKEQTLSSIIDFLKEKNMSIAELSRKLNIKRSSLIYYLNILEARNLIIKERKEKELLGRPTIIRINAKTLQETSEKERQLMANRLKNFEELNKEKITKILSFIEKNEKLNHKELLDKISKDYSFSPADVTLITTLEWSGFINTYHALTEKGKKFLTTSPSSPVIPE